MATSAVCCRVCLLLSRNRRLQSGAAVAHRSLSYCKRYSSAVASLPITQTSRSVRIKSDLLSHQTSPAGCGWLSALKPGTHSLSLGDSKTQHTGTDGPCLVFSLPATPLAASKLVLSSASETKRRPDWTKPVPGNLSALGRSRRDGVWSSRSLRQECRC